MTELTLTDILSVRSHNWHAIHCPELSDLIRIDIVMKAPPGMEIRRMASSQRFLFCFAFGTISLASVHLWRW